jgi:hypothetical protein
MEEKLLERLGREFVEAIDSRDADRAVALAHPDIVYQSVPLGGRRTYHGHDGLRRRIADLEPVDYNMTDLHVRVLDEQRFVALMKLHIEGVEQPGALVARAQDGLVIEARAYFSDESLLAELGVFETHQPARRSS